MRGITVRNHAHTGTPHAQVAKALCRKSPVLAQVLGHGGARLIPNQRALQPQQLREKPNKVRPSTMRF